MELLLIRAPATEDGEDAARPLTSEERRKLARVVRGLDRLGVRLDRVVHSPWTQAVQTANLVHQLVDGESQVEMGLARPPDAGLAARLAGDRVAAVGHEPWMSELLTLLVTGSTSHAERFRFKKGQVAWLRGDPQPGGMALVASLPPRVLRRI
jgi:phosphohistidine phosphatase